KVVTPQDQTKIKADQAEAKEWIEKIVGSIDENHPSVSESETKFSVAVLEALDDLPKEKIGEILMKAEGLKLDGRSKTVQYVMTGIAKREQAQTNHKKPERPDQATQFLEQYATGIPKLLKNAKSIGVVAGAIDQIAGYCQAKISQNEQVTKFGV